jgi:hypothetical protein
MSFLLFQQNLPFQTMRQFLRYWQPSSPSTPEAWAQRHAYNLRTGDVLFFLDPIYSPWGDSTSGIGVSEGDSFKVAQVCLVVRAESGQPMAIMISGDRYEAQPLEQFLAVQAGIAKSNGGGFYYAVGRKQQEVDANMDRHLAEIMARYGGSGSRSNNEQNLPDPLMTFFTTLGLQLEAAFTESVLDPGQLAFLLFSDKEPPAGTKLPDMRDVFVAAEGTNERADAAGAEPAAPGVKVPTGERPALYMELEEDDQGATMDAMPMLAKFQKRMRDGMSEEAAKDALLGAIVEAAESAASKPEQGQDDAAARAPIHIPMPQIPSIPMPQVPAAEARPAAAEGRTQGGFFAKLQAQKGVQPNPAGQPGMQPPAPPGDAQAPQPPTQPAAKPGKLAIKIPVPPKTQEATVPPLAASPPEVVPPGTPQSEDAGSSAARQQAPGQGKPSAANPWDAPGSSEPNPPAGPTGFSKLLGKVTQQPPKFSGIYSLNKMAGGVSAPPPVPDDIFDAPPEQSPTASASAETTLSTKPVSEADAAASWPVGAPESAPTTDGQKPNLKRLGAAPQVKISVPQIAPAEKIDPILATFGADVEEEKESPEPIRIEPPSSIAAVPPRKKKGEAGAPLESSRVSALKDPLNVKSGVAGLVSKLEQQATKASSRLEQQLDEIFEALNSEFSSAVDKVRDAEKISIGKTNELRAGFSARLQTAMNDVRIKIGDQAVVGREAIEHFVDEGEQAVDEKNKTLTESLNESFEEVRVRAEVLARSFQETSEAQRAKAMADLKQLMESLLNQFTEANEYYSFALDGIIEHVNEQVQDRSKSTAESLRANYEHLDNQLGQVYDRARKQLDHINQDVLSRLSQSIQAAELDFVTARLDAVQTQLTPQLRLHRDTLRALISEFQSKLISDLETKAAEIIEEFAPILDDKKQQISDVIEQTSKIRESVEERQRFDADRCDMDFRSFVEDTIEDAKAKFHRTAEQISEMDRSVRVLCDPANIEGDADLLNERESVLERMDARTSDSAQEIHESLNTSVASLEERAKQLQEELISRLEEDAYLVRKASEQALIRINTSIKETFTAIQIAQDEQME